MNFDVGANHIFTPEWLFVYLYFGNKTFVPWGSHFPTRQPLSYSILSIFETSLSHREQIVRRTKRGFLIVYKSIVHDKLADKGRSRWWSAKRFTKSYFAWCAIDVWRTLYPSQKCLRKRAMSTTARIFSDCTGWPSQILVAAKPKWITSDIIQEEGILLPKAAISLSGYWNQTSNQGATRFSGIELPITHNNMATMVYPRL